MKPTPTRIAEQVCRLAHVTLEELRSGIKRGQVTKCRIVISGLTGEMCQDHTPTDVARVIGYTTHSGVQAARESWGLMEDWIRDGWRFRVSTALKYWHSPDGLGGELASKAREELAVQR